MEPLTKISGDATVVLLVPGSLRAESFNLRLLREMARRLEGRCRIDLLNPREVDLPLFDGPMMHRRGPRSSSVMTRFLRRSRIVSQPHAGSYSVINDPYNAAYAPMIVS